MPRNELPIVTRLSPEGRARFDRAAKAHCFPAGQVAIVKGEAITGAYIVETGRLRVFSLSKEGCEATLYTIAPGETCVLAINSLFSAVPYPGHVVAEETTRILYVPGETWRALFRTESEIQNLTLKALSVAVMRLMHELESLHGRSVRNRLADLLIARRAADGSVRMTQAKIAAELGTAREVVARCLVDWSQRGIVECHRGLIRIIDPAYFSSNASLCEPTAMMPALD
ncbi:MAG: Crp/Fnr family transcriptional regulator [Bradyrhizobium sp.]|uniref:Crp/Fnr family transcriptional regulator n=1 Tax=Bradyrhizobium sp. TaxID=376 RepID=UPI0025BF0930|nr:Crp/Fnr family transcriptional regulator [Bradyrhizobium sp.]MBI5263577.1 Crp/Fnr family transcriptional regulator [Bradyrhizobium sp.]